MDGDGENDVLDPIWWIWWRNELKYWKFLFRVILTPGSIDGSGFEWKFLTGLKWRSFPTNFTRSSIGNWVAKWLGNLSFWHRVQLRCEYWHLVGKITFSHPLRSKILGKKGENLGKFGKICHFDTILNRLHLIWFEKLTLIEIGIFLDPFPSTSWKKGQNYRQIRYFDALLIRLHLIWFEKLTLVEIGKFLDPFRSKIMQNQAISRKICHFDTILNRLHLIWFEKLTLIEIGIFLNPFPSKSWKKMAKISENSTFWRHAHLTAFDLIRKMNLG